MYISVQAFREKALEVIQNCPTGEDTLIQCKKDGPGLDTREYQNWGHRTQDFKDQNRAVRQALVNALRIEFGFKNLDKLPPSLAKELKIGEFDLDKNGQVTSSKPLTARRIIAITDALAKLSEKEKQIFGTLQEFTQGRDIPTYDKIVMAREMGTPKAGAPTIKNHFALIAMDMAAAVRRANITIDGIGNPMTRLETYSKKVAEVIAPLWRDIVMQTQSCKLAKRFGNNIFDKTKHTEATSRYGYHEYGKGERQDIIYALSRILLASDPKIAETLAKIDKQTLGTRQDELFLSSISVSEATDDKVAEADNATRRYTKAVEQNSANVAELKKKYDEAIAESNAAGMKRDVCIIEADLFQILPFKPEAAPEVAPNHEQH